MREDPTERFRRLCNALANITEVMGEEGVIQIFDPDYDSRRKFDLSPEDGIYFNATRRSNSGHFIARRNGAKLDSYKLRYQLPGSNGFCQTFAIMNYVGNTAGLVPGEYGRNGYVALRFIQNCLRNATSHEQNLFAQAYNNIQTYDGYLRSFAALKEMVQELIRAYQKDETEFRTIIQTESTFDFA